MERFKLWQTWLFVLGSGICIFGLLLAFLGTTNVFQLMNQQIEPIFWREIVMSTEAKAFQSWVYGVLGATMAGWGICIAFIARYPFRNREKWAWNCLGIGVLCWYVVDTALSLSYNVYFNALFNTVLLIAALIPLVFSRKYFC